VDCFDALTSDRPYRTRLSDYEALRIVLDRRGSMYDPLIVDTFIQVLRRLGSNFDLDDSIPQVVSDIATGHKDSAVATASNAPAPMADDIGALYDLMRELQDKSSFDEIAVLLSNHIRSKVPVDVVAIFLHDSIAAELEIRYSSGNAESLDGLRIPLGQRLSGWVAANRQSICNSDPILDFGHEAPPGTRGLRSCLSTPIVRNDTLVGVLSLYSRQSNAFADIHRRSVEMVVREVAAPILEALERGTRTPAKSPPLAARVH